MEDKLVIAGKEFKSRLFIGTGKYSSNKVMAESIAASKTDMVTVALRRVDIENENDDMLAAIDREKYLLLPNTSGARDARQSQLASGMVDRDRRLYCLRPLPLGRQRLRHQPC